MQYNSMAGSPLVMTFLLALAGCGAPDADVAVLPAPPALQDGWQVGDAAAAGFDAAALVALGNEIDNGAYPNTHALLIESDGVLVYERYFSGTDERWGDALGARAFGRDDLHDLRSISKSVTATLLGIALADAGVTSDADLDAAPQRPAIDYLPGLEARDDRRAVTLHHVLTMTAGLEWNEMTVPYTDDTNDEIRLYDAADPAAYVFDRPLVQTASYPVARGSPPASATATSVSSFCRTRCWR